MQLECILSLLIYVFKIIGITGFLFISCPNCLPGVDNVLDQSVNQAPNETRVITRIDQVYLSSLWCV